MSVKIAQIRLLRAIAEEGTLIAAARRLNYVPSNITARLRDFEAIVGARLVNREHGRFTLTSAGRLLLAHGERLLDEADAIDGLIRDGRPFGDLTVAALDVALERFIPRGLPDFIDRFPNTRLKLLCRPTLTIEQMVMNGSADIGLSDGPIVHPLLDSQPAFREHLFLATPAGHRPDDPDSLSRLCAFSFDVDCFYNVAFDTWLNANGIRPARRIVVESYTAMHDCIARGIGMACVPESYVPEVQDSGVAYHPVDGLGPSDVVFIQRKSRPNALCEGFVHTMIEARGTAQDDRSASGVPK